MQAMQFPADFDAATEANGELQVFDRGMAFQFANANAVEISIGANLAARLQGKACIVDIQIHVFIEAEIEFCFRAKANFRKDAVLDGIEHGNLPVKCVMRRMKSRHMNEPVGERPLFMKGGDNGAANVLQAPRRGKRRQGDEGHAKRA